MAQYEKAYATMHSLAETSEHAYAQYYLGMMHLNGQSVEQDFEEAGSWFRKASKQGIPRAQFKLATQYLNGQGFALDYKMAYGWFRVAAAQGHQKSIAAVSNVTEMISEEEMEEAELLSRQLIEKYRPGEKEGEKLKRAESE